MLLLPMAGGAPVPEEIVGKMGQINGRRAAAAVPAKKMA